MADPPRTEDSSATQVTSAAEAEVDEETRADEKAEVDEETGVDEEAVRVPDGILVLGMHRSGTSALMGALSLLGVDLGEPLMTAQDDNPRGFFEHMDFYFLHRQLLDRFGHVWDDLRGFEVADLPPARVAASVDELEEMIQRHFAGPRLWAVKDPRLCRLHDFWSQALGRLGSSPRFVVALRHPDEVVSSLQSRDGFSRDKGDILWADHVLSAERHSRGSRRGFVGYAELLAAPVATMQRLADHLGLLWPRSGTDVEAEVCSFLERGLKHHEAEEIEPEPRGLLGDLVPRVHRALRGATSDPDAVDTDALDRCRHELDERLDRLQSLLLEQATQLHIRERQSLFHHTETRLTQVQEALAERDRRLDRQQQELEALRDLVHRLEAQLGERTEWLEVQDRLLHQQMDRLARLDPGDE